MRDQSEAEYLQKLWEQNICPYCGNGIAAGKRVGTGRMREGGFCSLTCYGQFYQMELVRRAQHVMKVVQKHENS